MSFASIVLLSHAVVPHHHHDSMACFVLPYEGGHEHDACVHHDTDHQEKHDTDQNNDCCILNDILAVIPDNYKQEDLNFDFSLILNNTNCFLSMIIVPDLEKEQLIFYKDFRQRPILVNSYEVYAAHSLGLRAPPCC